jgi:hypothetical protein
MLSRADATVTGSSLGETGYSTRIAPALGHADHPTGRTAAPEQRQQLLQVVVGALGDDLDPTVVEVACPAGQSELECVGSDPPAHAHALNLAAYPGRQALVTHQPGPVTMERLSRSVTIARLRRSITIARLRRSITIARLRRGARVGSVGTGRTTGS